MSLATLKNPFGSLGEKSYNERVDVTPSHVVLNAKWLASNQQAQAVINRSCASIITSARTKPSAYPSML